MTADRPGLFVLASLRAPDLDCGSRLTGIAATKESGGERAWPLIMTWCPDKRAVNSGLLPRCPARSAVTRLRFVPGHPVEQASPLLRDRSGCMLTPTVRGSMRTAIAVLIRHSPFLASEDSPL